MKESINVEKSKNKYDNIKDENFEEEKKLMMSKYSKYLLGDEIKEEIEEFKEKNEDKAKKSLTINKDITMAKNFLPSIIKIRKIFL